MTDKQKCAPLTVDLRIQNSHANRGRDRKGRTKSQRTKSQSTKSHSSCWQPPGARRSTQTMPAYYETRPFPPAWERRLLWSGLHLFGAHAVPPVILVAACTGCLALVELSSKLAPCQTFPELTQRRAGFLSEAQARQRRSQLEHMKRRAVLVAPGAVGRMHKLSIRHCASLLTCCYCDVNVKHVQSSLSTADH